MDGTPAVVLQIRFHRSSPGCLRLTTLPLSLWGQVDCNFGDGVGILAQHVPNPAPPLPSDDGLHIVLLAPRSAVTVGDGSRPKDALDFPRGLCERTTAGYGQTRSSASALIYTEGSTIRSSGRASA